VCWSRAEHLLMDVALERFHRRKLATAHGVQRSASTQVLVPVRAVNRLELMRDTL
jgi:hypothetical protein